MANNSYSSWMSGWRHPSGPKLSPGAPGAVQGGARVGAGRFGDHAKYSARKCKPLPRALTNKYGANGKTLIVVMRPSA